MTLRDGSTDLDDRAIELESELSEPLFGLVAVEPRFEQVGESRDPDGADGARGALQRVGSVGSLHPLARSGDDGRDPTALLHEQRQELPLELPVAERLAYEVSEVERQ